MAFRNSKKFDSIIEGFMEKLSSKKKWQKRYFVLNEHSLVYYPDKKKSLAKVREVMCLENVSKVEMIEVGNSKAKTFEVQITCGSNFPYPLKTPNKQEADQWLDALLSTLQDAKSQRSSQGNMKTQQDMMMQVAMAMNMGLQMGMQNNNDQLAILGSIHQSTMDGRQNVMGELQQRPDFQPGLGPTLEFEGPAIDGATLDAMDEVDGAIAEGEAKTMDAVNNALKEAQMLAECVESDEEVEVQPTPAELAQDAGVDLTASFANFYNDAFGDYEDSEIAPTADPIEDEDDPFGEESSAPVSKAGLTNTQQAAQATVNP